jgi:hypothetical protein
VTCFINCTFAQESKASLDCFRKSNQTTIVKVTTSNETIKRTNNKQYLGTEFISSIYRGADKSLAQPTSRCILFDDENVSFDANLVIHINNTNISPIMIINRVYQNQNILLL